MNDFIDWLNNQLRKRAWSNNELARRTRYSSSNVSLVLTGQQAPSWEFCYRVAQALSEPPEKAFRLAGLLPPAPPERDPLAQEIQDIIKQLSPGDREELLAYARLRYQRAQER
ncbi:MAG: helix-turn-helix transcriptional regulator [Anaerolineales bacterium]|nr:helix-turn-helix transcriptional regulator [Anaerolineales bacterium]